MSVLSKKTADRLAKVAAKAAKIMKGKAKPSMSKRPTVTLDPKPKTTKTMASNKPKVKVVDYYGSVGDKVRLPDGKIGVVTSTTKAFGFVGKLKRKVPDFKPVRGKKYKWDLMVPETPAKKTRKAA